MIRAKKAYRAELTEKGLLSGLYQPAVSADFNMVNGGPGMLCITSSDRQPTHTHRYYDGIEPADVPLKEFVTVQDFYPEFVIADEQENVVSFKNAEYHADMQYRFEEDGFMVTASAWDARIIQFGMAVPLSFLGSSASEFRHQLMASSPYTSSDGRISYFLLPRPNGSFLLITALGQMDGWKLDYSEYNYGHFILNLKMLEQFDACYKQPHSTLRHQLTLWFDFPFSVSEAFSIVSKRTGLPCAELILSGGVVGTTVPVRIHGDCGKIILATRTGEQSLEKQGDRVMIPLVEEGFHRITVYGNGGAFDFAVYAYPSIQELWLRSLLAIRKPYHNDANLTEGGVWCWAMLAYMRRYGTHKRLLPAVQEFMEQEVLTQNPEKAIAHCTLWPGEQRINGRAYHPWHIWQSTRVQEQFFGISILLEASRALQKESYLECAVKAADCLLQDHMTDDGKIWRIDDAGNEIDYTTVCAPVIALADLARELAARKDHRADHLFSACERIADYLVRRGFSFPTEADPSYAARELEDGSISCTALSVLYVCYYVHYKPEYVDFARRVLQFHDAWICYTPDVRMYRSTFRWWELIWEGDQDGPAICAGHAWTIWRAEADFYLAMLTGDSSAAKQSYSAYLTNLCKVEPDGNMTAAFVADWIPYRTSEGVLGHKYPKKKDCSLSRYVWVRSMDTWLTAGGVFVTDGTIETIQVKSQRRDATISVTPLIQDLAVLFVDAEGFSICLERQTPLQVVVKQDIIVRQGYIQKADGHTFLIAPENGKIVLCA